MIFTKKTKILGGFKKQGFWTLLLKSQLQVKRAYAAPILLSFDLALVKLVSVSHHLFFCE